MAMIVNLPAYMAAKKVALPKSKGSWWKKIWNYALRVTTTITITKQDDVRIHFFVVEQNTNDTIEWVLHDDIMGHSNVHLSLRLSVIIVMDFFKVVVVAGAGMKWKKHCILMTHLYVSSWNRKYCVFFWILSFRSFFSWFQFQPRYLIPLFDGCFVIVYKNTSFYTEFFLKKKKTTHF